MTPKARVSNHPGLSNASTRFSAMLQSATWLAATAERLDAFG